MTTYERSTNELNDSLAAVMEHYHPHLRDAGLAVEILRAYAPRDDNDDPVGPALKLHGYECCATIKILDLKNRVAGRGDAELLLDGDNLDTWSEDQLRAILDHELTHLELRVDDHGGVQRDDFGRPLLRIRKHDRQFGWFDCVALRHGMNSVEMQQATQITSVAELRQLYLPGMSQVMAKQKK